MTAPQRPKATYLDQCVVSHMAGEPGQSFSDTKFGRVVEEAMQKGTGEVWASPVHVIETALCADFDDKSNLVMNDKLVKRQHIALRLLEAIEGRRMMPSHSTLIVRELMDHLEQVAPGSIRTRNFFDKNSQAEAQLYLGALGLLASYKKIGHHDGMATLIRTKLTSHLIHSRHAKNPEQMVEHMIQGALTSATAGSEIWEPYDKMSLGEMQAETLANEAATVKMNNAAKQKFQRNKKDIAGAYAATETSQAIAHVFQHDYEILMTFNLERIREHWDALRKAWGGELEMPPELAAATPGQCLARTELMVLVLKHLLRTGVKHSLLGGHLIMTVLLGELEACLTKGEVPTAGLMFDADHICAMLDVNVIATTDERFEMLAKQAANTMKRVTNGKWLVTVVNSAEQLDRAIRQ
jgi:hypothetical protein